MTTFSIKIVAQGDLIRCTLKVSDRLSTELPCNCYLLIILFNQDLSVAQLVPFFKYCITCVYHLTYLNNV